MHSLNENKLWPWYGYNGRDENRDLIRPPTKFGDNILDTYHSLTYKGLLYKKCCCVRDKSLKYLDTEDLEYIKKQDNQKTTKRP